MMNGPLRAIDYTWESFKNDFSQFHTKEDDYEEIGLMALHLLMKGSFVSELETLLDEESMPVSVKLTICHFFIKHGYMSMHEKIQRILVATTNESLKTWQEKTEQ